MITKTTKYYKVKKAGRLTLLLPLSALCLASCSDFLDKEPDERSNIDTEDKVVQLLVGSYPSANYGWICELSSDNMMDNNVSHLPISSTAEQTPARYNLSSFDRTDDEIFRFEQGVSTTNQDSPSYVWEDFYQSVMKANYALESIEAMAASNGGELSATLKACRAEALLIRAYDHFVLLNTYSQAYKGEEASKSDIGVPYVTTTSTDFEQSYDRGNVADCYKKIIADLEAALPDLNDSHLKNAPKYHFNTNAAHAFAARVYLFHHDWEKAEQQATMVLGEDYSLIATRLIDFTGMDECTSMNDYAVIYQNPNSANNLMLLNTISSISRHSLGYRYAQNSLCCREIYYHRTPFTGLYAYPFIYVGGWTFWTGRDYGYTAAKIGEEFEYSDKLAGIGFAHTIRREFTNNMLLLERAEARIMQGNYAGAFSDMKAWLHSYQTFSDANMRTFRDSYGMRDITETDINSYFTPRITAEGDTSANYNCFLNWNLTPGKINASGMGLNIVDAAVPYMNCLNEFRRIETCWDGLRFWDLKRWGIEYSHSYWDYEKEGTDKTVTIHLAWNDPRRAIEVPQSSIEAGLQPSRPQLQQPSNEGSLQRAPMEKPEKDEK